VSPVKRFNRKRAKWSTDIKTNANNLIVDEEKDTRTSTVHTLQMSVMTYKDGSKAFSVEEGVCVWFRMFIGFVQLEMEQCLCPSRPRVIEYNHHWSQKNPAWLERLVHSRSSKWCRNWTEHKIKKRMKIPVKVQLLRIYSRAFGAQLLRQEKSVGYGQETSLYVEKVWKP